MMARDYTDPQSYFAVAGTHWLPGPNFYCRHHDNSYNPWHRNYLLMFEDCMRTVSGCEDVTLPYWDITDKEIPVILSEEPFANFKLPVELCPLEGECYPLGYITKRHPDSTIIENINVRYKIPDNIVSAQGFSHWERFNGWDAGRTQDGIILAHDGGHNSIGTTMQNQDIAAFDPVFWFFHANWDRLWWKWQQAYQATTLERFKTHILGSTDWLDDPVLNSLPPFSKNSSQTIDLSKLNVSYSHPDSDSNVVAIRPNFGSNAAEDSFTLSDSKKVSVRVKNIDRLQIPGSFDVSLFAGEKRIATQGFFQSTSPKQCDTCRKKALVSIDFEVDQAELVGDKVRVSVELLRDNGSRSLFPLSSCGSPTINARLLLEE